MSAHDTQKTSVLYHVHHQQTCMQSNCKYHTRIAMIRLENAKSPLQKLTSNRVADQKSWLTNHLVYEGRQLPAPRLKIVQLICLILSAHQNRLKGHADHQTKSCRAFCKDSLPGIWFITVSIAKKINCIHPGLSTENRKVFAPVSTAGNGLFCCQQMCLGMYKHLLYLCMH